MSMEERNLVTALTLGYINWFEFFEMWKALK
jgi:hypothetical protein